MHASHIVILKKKVKPKLSNTIAVMISCHAAIYGLEYYSFQMS